MTREKVLDRRQVSRVPQAYPKSPSELAHLDLEVRAKLLKSHLEDAFAQGAFSVTIRRRRGRSHINVVYDACCTYDQVKAITDLYLDGSTAARICLRTQKAAMETVT